MAVNASIQLWSPSPWVAPISSHVTLEVVITNTGTSEEDFRVRTTATDTSTTSEVQFVDFSEAAEIAPGQQNTYYIVFTMPHRSIDLSMVSQWHDKTATPSRWTDVGACAQWQISVGESEEPIQITEQVGDEAVAPAPAARNDLLYALGGFGLLLFLWILFSGKN